MSRRSEDLSRQLVAEALGTGALVLIGCGAAMLAALQQPFGLGGVAAAFGLAVAILVATFGPVSGAHINPAVTIAFWSVGRFPTRDVVPYVLAQCAGAIAGAFVLRWLHPFVIVASVTAPGTSVLRAFVIEAGYSWLLAMAIFATSSRHTPRALPPLIIGATVCAGALVTGPFTGGSFNPARSLGPALAANVWTAHWLYWAAPIIGMLIAGRVFTWMWRANVDDAPETLTP